MKHLISFVPNCSLHNVSFGQGAYRRNRYMRGNRQGGQRGTHGYRGYGRGVLQAVENIEDRNGSFDYLEEKSQNGPALPATSTAAGGGQGVPKTQCQGTLRTG